MDGANNNLTILKIVDDEWDHEYASLAAFGSFQM